MDTVNYLVEHFTTLLAGGGLIAGFILIIFESIIPALPLGVFVTLNINAFGFVLGILISWLATCIGCYLSYLLFSAISNKFIYKHISDKRKKQLERATTKFKSIPFSNLTVIIALPFTPAFLINIASGMAGISKKKFLLSLLIGKIFMIFFWGYVGKSLIESITDISSIIIVAIMLIVAYFISKFVSKKAHIE